MTPTPRIALARGASRGVLAGLAPEDLERAAGVLSPPRGRVGCASAHRVESSVVRQGAPYGS